MEKSGKQMSKVNFNLYTMRSWQNIALYFTLWEEWSEVEWSGVEWNRGCTTIVCLDCNAITEQNPIWDTPDSPHLMIIDYPTSKSHFSCTLILLIVVQFIFINNPVSTKCSSYETYSPLSISVNFNRLLIEFENQ